MVDTTENLEGLTATLTCQDEAPYRGDYATGEALAVFQITQDELDSGWSPPVFRLPGSGA